MKSFESRFCIFGHIVFCWVWNWKEENLFFLTWLFLLQCYIGKWRDKEQTGGTWKKKQTGIWWHWYFLPMRLPCFPEPLAKKVPGECPSKLVLFFLPISHRVHGRKKHEAALPCRLDLLVSHPTAHAKGRGKAALVLSCGVKRMGRYFNGGKMLSIFIGP